MHTFSSAPSAPLTRLPDGTVKQVNPFTGTHVWTVPGRGNRPLTLPPASDEVLGDGDHTHLCAFCQDNYALTPPEKARVVRDPDGSWHTMVGVGADDMHATVAEFRRVPNLFEILSFDFWSANYGSHLTADAAARLESYLSTPSGVEHCRAIVRTKMAASGTPVPADHQMSLDELRERVRPFFASGHDVIVGRRHVVDGAHCASQLASSGTLSVEEHRAYIAFTIEGMKDIYASNPWVRYVAVFQNWLRPAGASFDHLHKQLVGIDEHAVSTQREVDLLHHNPNSFNDLAVNYAVQQGLLIAANEHAVAFAGFGHRYPTVEVYSRSACTEPWRMDAAERDGMADVLHAVHAATGPAVPCNEEWHHTPLDVDTPMPWHINIKWRVSTVAGFEGGTKIYINTIDPWTLRKRVVGELMRLRHEGLVADDLAIGDECPRTPNMLRYNPYLTRV